MRPERLLQHFETISDSPDAVAKLRQLVLNLAVRGKLVEQDPEDEPASLAIQRYAALHPSSGVSRKSCAERDGALAATPVEPAFAPAGWILTTLGNVGDWGSGSTPSRAQSDYYGGAFPWLKSGELGDSMSLSGSEETVTEKALNECSFRRNQPGDVLIAMYGATIGKLAILAEPAVTNQAVCGCTPHPFLLNRFLFIFLLSHRASFQASSEGGAQPNISKVKIVNTAIAIPPLAEQGRIVAKVDELMALCDQMAAARTRREATRDLLSAASLARLNNPDPDTFLGGARFALDALPALTNRVDQVKQLRQTILDLAVRGKLVEQHAEDEPASQLLVRINAQRAAVGLTDPQPRPRDTEAPFPLPSAWRMTRLGELCSKTGSGSTPRGGKEVYRSSGVAFLRSQNVHNDGIRLDDVAYIDSQTHQRMSGTQVLGGDLLLNITGGSIGRCARVPEFFCEANISQHVAIIRPAMPETQRFLHWLILSPYFQGFVIDEQTGAGRGGLPKNRMDRILVPVPPLPEQHRIVAMVDGLMSLCDQVEAALTHADTTRRRLLDALLQEALTPALEAAA